MPAEVRQPEIAIMRQMETRYRKHLHTDPSDTFTRMSLAWCLWMQTLYQAGHRDALAALAETLLPDEEALAFPGGELLVDRESTAGLLQACLQEAQVVVSLASSDRDRAEARRLLALISLLAGEAVVSRSEQELMNARTRLSQNVATFTADWDADPDPTKTGATEAPPPAPAGPRRRSPRSLKR